MQDLQSRTSIPEKGFWIQVPGFRLLDLGAWIQEASRNGYGSASGIRSRDPDPGSGSGIPIPDPAPGSGIQIRDPDPEPGSGSRIRIWDPDPGSG